MKTDKEIFDSYAAGNIVYMTADGLKEVPMSEFQHSGPDNILKSLNRTEDIILKVHSKKPDSLKWINDYAVGKVISALCNENANLEQWLNEAKSSVSVSAENGQADIDKLNESLETASAKIDELQKQLTDMTNRMDEEHAEKVQYQVFAQNSKEAADKAEELLNKIQSEKDDLANDNYELKQELEKLKKSVSDKETEYSNYKSKLSTLSTELDSEKIKVDNITKEYETLKTEHNNATELIDKYKETNADLSKDIDTLKQNIKLLEDKQKSIEHPIAFVVTVNPKNKQVDIGSIHTELINDKNEALIDTKTKSNINVAPDTQAPKKIQEYAHTMTSATNQFVDDNMPSMQI